MGSALKQRAGACAALACMKKAGQEHSTNPGATGVFKPESGLAGRICGSRTAVPWKSFLLALASSGDLVGLPTESACCN